MDTQNAELANNASGSDPQIESLTEAELNEFKKVNDETIAGLKNDINLIKWKLKQFGPGALPRQDYDSLLRQGNSEAIDEVKEKLKKEIEGYTNRVKETIRLTGVTVDKFSKDVQFLDGSRCETVYTLEATVYNRQVCLSCTAVKDFPTPGAEPQPEKVTWFQIQFQEDIHNAIGEEVAKAADKLALHHAFGVLKSYLAWKKERDQVVSSLSEANPEAVSLFTSQDGNYCLVITSPKPSRPVFTVEWGRKIVEGKVLSDVHLKVDAPKRWTAMDTNHVMDSAPQIFETMIRTLGLEKALEAFVQLVTTDGQPSLASQSPREGAGDASDGQQVDNGVS